VLSQLLHSTLDPEVHALTPHPTHETCYIHTICPLQASKRTTYRRPKDVPTDAARSRPGTSATCFGDQKPSRIGRSACNLSADLSLAAHAGRLHHAGAQGPRAGTNEQRPMSSVVCGLDWPGDFPAISGFELVRFGRFSSGHGGHVVAQTDSCALVGVGANLRVIGRESAWPCPTFLLLSSDSSVERQRHHEDSRLDSGQYQPDITLNTPSPRHHSQDVPGSPTRAVPPVSPR
jgi:hypothetical protein